MKKILMALAALAVSVSAFATDRSTVIISNQTANHTIFYIYSSPPTAEYFGTTDVLGGNIIVAGSERPVDFDTADAQNECIQDVIAKSRQGGVWRKRMNVCTTVRWTLYD